MAFHKQFYSSNLMKLVVYGKEELERLEQWATSMFSTIENKEVTLPSYSEPVMAYNEKNLSHIYRIVPVKNVDSIKFIWFLPYYEKEWDTQPLRYHSHILGHEGPNSLLSHLIEEGLALGLTTYFDYELGSFSNMCLEVTLTKKGFERYEQVVEAVFKHIEILKKEGAKQYIFEEYQRVGELHWQFLEKRNYMSYITRLADRMQKFDESNMSRVLDS